MQLLKLDPSYLVKRLFVSFSHSSQSQPVLERNCRLVELHTLNSTSHHLHLAIEHKISYYWTYCYFQTKLENRISTHKETAHKKLLLLCTVCSFLISKMWDKRHHMVVIHNQFTDPSYVYWLQLQSKPTITPSSSRNKYLLQKSLYQADVETPHGFSWTPLHLL